MAVSKLGNLVPLPVATPCVLGMMPGTVFAASEKKQSTDTLMINELSLYTTPQPRLRYEEPTTGQVEQGMSELRKAAEPYTSWCQGKSTIALEKVQEVYRTIEPAVESSVQLAKDGYELVNDPPPKLLPSVGAIGFSGILGLYLANGYKARRILFPTILMALSASVFYPQHAASLTTVTKDQLQTMGSHGREMTQDLWKKMSSLLGTTEKKRSEKSSKS